MSPLTNFPNRLIVGLAADIGFGHAELVDTVADGAHDLLHGHFFGKAAQFGGELVLVHAARGVGDGAGLDEVGEPFAHHFFEGGNLIGAGQNDFEPALGIEAGLHDGDLFLVRTVTHVLTGDGERVLQSLVHVHAEREVHAALEVEAEVDAVFHKSAERGTPDEGDVGQGIGHYHKQNHDGYGKAQAQSFHCGFLEFRGKYLAARKHKNPTPFKGKGAEVKEAVSRGLLLVGGFGLGDGLGVVRAAHEAAGHTDLGFTEVDHEDVAFDIDDTAEEAAGSHDVGALAERFDHGLVFLVALLLGADQQEVPMMLPNLLSSRCSI